MKNIFDEELFNELKLKSRIIRTGAWETENKNEIQEKLGTMKTLLKCSTKIMQAHTLR